MDRDDGVGEGEDDGEHLGLGYAPVTARALELEDGEDESIRHLLGDVDPRNVGVLEGLHGPHAVCEPSAADQVGSHGGS